MADRLAVHLVVPMADRLAVPMADRLAVHLVVPMSVQSNYRQHELSAPMPIGMMLIEGKTSIEGNVPQICGLRSRSFLLARFFETTAVLAYRHWGVPFE